MSNHTPLEGIRLAIMTFAVAVGTFMQVLDASIANVAVPTIAGNLAVSDNDGTWIITSFAVSNAVVLPLTGWLSKQIGSVKLFCLSTALFSISSWTCGMAWSLASLVVFRTIQGAVAGCLIPLSQSILLSNYPKEKQGFALAIWTMIVVVAPVIGPVLGGWITFDYGWGWIFFINVPLGFLSSWLAWTVLKDRETPTQKLPFDLFALVLLCLAVGSLQIGLDKGNQWDWFRSNIVIMLTACFVVSTTLFIIWNKNSANPVIDFKFFKDRNFVLGTFLVTLGYTLYFGAAVLAPIWLQDVMGYTPTWAGLAVMPLGIPAVFTCLWVSRLMEWMDARTLVTISFVIFAATFYWYSIIDTEISFYAFLIPRFWQGFAIAVFFLPLVKVALFDMPHEDLPGASGVFNFVRILVGSGICTSLSVTFYDRRGALFHSDIGSLVSLDRPETRNFFDLVGQMGFSFDQGLILLNDMVTQQGYTVSIMNFFWLSSLLFVLSIPIIWMCKIKKET